jgi:hypothetical protein
VSVGKRRRDTGLLKVLGFVRRQTAFAMSWQTTTVAVVGLVVGLPLGIAAGRLGWDLFAGYVGFVAVPVVVAWGLMRPRRARSRSRTCSPPGRRSPRRGSARPPRCEPSERHRPGCH